MLPKVLRLVKSREFAQIYKNGERLSSPNLRIFYASKKNQNASRFGFVISKKQARKIAARNRIKRILRAHIAKLKSEIQPGFEVVFHGRPGILRLEGGEIRKELENLLKRGRIIKI
ncbi:MAG: ribonuclease P protein component [Candidatus Doudnabacteria bacterium]|nr:ribonuclease P protein component [Candidatus Doudnabacteria bacterium]